MTWRLLLINPLAIGAVLLLGVVGCRLAGLAPHPAAGGLAAVAGLMASSLAAVPLLRTRWSDPAGPTRAALMALMVHLGLMLVLGLAGLVAVNRAEKLPLVIWTLAMFWATLAGVATIAHRAVSAEAAGTTTPPMTPPPQ